MNAERPREYVQGVSSRGRPTLTLNRPERDIGFSVWRDLLRVAGTCRNEPECTVFEFLIPERLPKGEEVLQGAMWVKKEVCDDEAGREG